MQTTFIYSSLQSKRIRLGLRLTSQPSVVQFQLYVAVNYFLMSPLFILYEGISLCTRGPSFRFAASTSSLCQLKLARTDGGRKTHHIIALQSRNECVSVDRSERLKKPPLPGLKETLSLRLENHVYPVQLPRLKTVIRGVTSRSRGVLNG